MVFDKASVCESVGKRERDERVLSRCTIRHTSFLVDLDGRLVGTDPNDFANEIVMSDFDLFAEWVSKLPGEDKKVV